MIIRCSGCKTTFTFDSEPPKFCQECGCSLKDEQTHAGELANPTEFSDVTIAPTTSVTKPGRGLHAGERIENYELISILGSGGMGVVWKAVDTNNGRQVALKRLSSNHLSDQDSVTRFKREAQLASRISHPRVTFVYSAGRLDDQPFIAMELMPGETLDDRVKQDGPLPVGEAVDKILDVIDGLDAAHGMGLIHRDVKPSNCFIDSDERVKIGDFGLSKSVISTDVELTRTGTFMGTPAYAAPEQIRGEKLDNRTDIYAVGATLCCLLTGRPPFVGDAMTVTAQIITDSPKIDNDLPRELIRILQSCLEKNRSKRYQSLQELRNALLPFAQSQDSLAAIGRRVSAYMIDIVLVAVAIGVCLGGFGAYAGVMSKVKDIPVEDMLGPISWIGPIFGFIVPLMYFFLLEAFTGKTIGKRLLGLKVIDHEGAKPSWSRALLRAFFIPGGAAVPLVVGLILVAIWPMTTSPVDTTLRTAVNSLISVVPLLIILSPIIRRTGNEGWHEILSGTQVITDGRPATRQLLIPDPKPKCDGETFMLGPYNVGQILHRTDDTTVYLGVDTQLNRNVWVHLCNDSDCAPSEQRILLSRTTRQRWLDGGVNDEGKRWDAFEAVEGLPLQTVIASRYEADWPEYKKLIQDVSDELKIAIKDGTMPETLSLPQVWLDRNGNAKIIDRSLVDVVDNIAPDDKDPRLSSIVDSWSEQSLSDAHRSPEQFASRLVKTVGKAISKTENLPLSAQSFLAELRKQPDSASTLNWTTDKLRSLKGKLNRIDWETRVGVLGITVGIEYLLYSTISAFMYLLAFFVIPAPHASRFFIGLSLSLIVPVVLGVIFHGGPIFHLMGISVTNQKGKQVGYLKLVVRSFLSWLPAFATTGVWMIIVILGNSQSSGVEPEAGSVAEYIMENPLTALYAMGLGLLCFLSMACGVLTTLISPRRGLQDYLIGTRLTPK
ncbi:protein kinase domain-containing protein [Mariniblastus fucicola]|uniref:Serine/threonine-protein kinase PknB n=1 Tax=Mariniblastus fucicola TaxID=980251 RepID=A0A5B9P3C7_9BACT|nr:protein kinase [Mariniblastus fucicola]QEG20684.1 Serine/threonine-protein kinase PknB [Mariniblastus fucicola]